MLVAQVLISFLLLWLCDSCDQSIIVTFETLIVQATIWVNAIDVSLVASQRNGAGV